MEDLLLFLKKYSDVDTDFIKNFIDIRNNKNSHFPFSIDLDIVVEWLKTNKHKLKKTLIKTYIEKIDYIILQSKIKKDSKGGHNKEIILMTPDTFKMLTMKSKTKDAQKVRYYYVTLEKLVEIYKDEIIENQNKKIKILERNLKKIKYPVKGALYIIKLTEYDNEGFRIGKTSNMNVRVKGYNTHNKDDPEVVYTFYTHDRTRLEKCVRNTLKYFEYRNNKDFYITSKEKIIEALSKCDDLMTYFINDENDKNEEIKNNNEKISREKNTDILFKIEFEYETDQKGGFIKSYEMIYTKNKSNYFELEQYIISKRLI